MKNLIKKMLAALAAFAVMVSVVMPCAVEDDNAPGPTYEIWDEYDVTNRN